jgi:hypothetical protein
LKPLQGLRELRVLELDRQFTDLEIITRLPNLEYLSLQSLAARPLDWLGELAELRALRLAMGSAKDLRFLRDSSVRYLELWQIRGFTNADLDVLANPGALEVLFLDRLTGITELTAIPTLRRLHLNGMTGLQSIGDMRGFTSMQELIVESSKQLTPDAFQAIAGHPVLKRARIGLGSDRANREVEALLNLPPPPPLFDFEFAD